MNNSVVVEKSWWKEVIMYQIYPRSFKDSNGDGIGDLRGIISKVDHLADLGINLVWLSPIYMSPNDDNGYDISDYYSIHPEFGTMEDFKELLSILHQNGIRLIMDLVVNHSSDEHEWFIQSKSSKDNKYRDYYIWKDGVEGGPPNNYKAWFGGDAWEYDQETNQYYLHLFTKKQPDLNWENPALRKEVYKMMNYWLDLGVDGFRMDVISLLSKELSFADSKSTNIHYLAEHHYANGPRIHEFLQEMVDQTVSNYDVMTVGEGPGITKELALNYIGKDRGELNMIFQLDHMIIDHGPEGKFDVQIFDMNDLRVILNSWDAVIGNEGWNNIFLDNHDFPRMVSRFGNDELYRYESATLLATLLLTLRGTPCIYQGSEIGMKNVKFLEYSNYRDIESINYIDESIKTGKSKDEILMNLHIQSRDNVRTPVQWDESLNAGFSTGVPWINVDPTYTEINLKKDKESNRSIFNYYRDLINFRKSQETFIYGSYEDLSNDHPRLWHYKRTLHDKSLQILLNFSNEKVRLDKTILGEKVFGNYQNDGSSLDLEPWEARIVRE